MKLKILYMVIIIFTLVAVQGSVVSFFEIYGVMPNVLFVFAIIFSLSLNSSESIIIGAAAGLCMDIIAGKIIGPYILIFMTSCFLINILGYRLYKESVLIIVVFTFVFSLANGLFFYFITFLLKGYNSLGYAFLRIIVPESIYNSLVSIVAFYIGRPIIRKYIRLDRIHTRI